MYELELLRAWKAEEDAAYIHGCNFSKEIGRCVQIFSGFTAITLIFRS